MRKCLLPNKPSLTDYYNAKNTLLKYYSDVQISLGTRILALGAIIFALFQATNYADLAIFSVPFYFALIVVILPIIRTAFRYAAISGYCNSIITHKTPDKIEMSIHSSICALSYEKMDKVFMVFPSDLFFAGTLPKNIPSEASNDDSKQKISKWDGWMRSLLGWLISLVIAEVLALALVWMFQ